MCNVDIVYSIIIIDKMYYTIIIIYYNIYIIKVYMFNIKYIIRLLKWQIIGVLIIQAI